MLSSSEERDISSRRTTRRRTSVSREDQEIREPRVSRRMTRTSRREVPAPKPEIDPNVILESRKAPTPLAADKEVKIEKRKKLVVTLMIMMIGVGISAAIGFTDSGQIDVKQTIEARNERIRNNQADERDTITSTVEVPVQDTDSVGKVDGGLIGRGTGGRTPEPALDLASTTASSTDGVASSTEAVASSTEEVGAEAEAARPSDAPPETPTTEVTQ
jgi:hypothetical protein